MRRRRSTWCPTSSSRRPASRAHLPSSRRREEEVRGERVAPAIQNWRRPVAVLPLLKAEEIVRTAQAPGTISPVTDGAPDAPLLSGDLPPPGRDRHHCVTVDVQTVGDSGRASTETARSPSRSRDPWSRFACRYPRSFRARISSRVATGRPSLVDLEACRPLRPICPRRQAGSQMWRPSRASRLRASR